MKPFLIVLNTVLLALLLWSVSAHFGGDEVALPVRSDRQKSTSTATAPETLANVYDTAELVPVIAGNNIFDPQRAPNADPGQRNVELTLVGTFQMGEKAGAVILQQAQQRRNNMIPGMGGDGMQPIGMAMPEDVQQRIAEYRNARFGAPGAPGTPATAQNYSFKQYVTVGESLESGYTLAEVTDKKAILTRGSERLELTLADPSKNAPATTTTANAARRPRDEEIFRAVQSAQMFQNMQMMRMMQMMVQQQQRATGGNANTGRGGSAGFAPGGGGRGGMGGGANMGSGGGMGGGNSNMGGGSGGSRSGGTGGRTGGRTSN